MTLLSAAALTGCGSSARTSSSSHASTPGPTSTPSTTGTGTTGAAHSAAAQIGFENVPIEQGHEIGPAGGTRTDTIDGIRCGATEQLAYHIHAHLAVYVNGRPRSLPGGIGIPGSQVVQSTAGPVAQGGRCIYWLHTHAPDGIVHIESPTRRIYTLGNFFDEWHQPLDRTRIGALTGALTFRLDGRRWTRDPRQIPLEPHAAIQVDVGRPAAPFMSVDWSQTRL